MWPHRVPTYVAGTTVRRDVELFNGALSGRLLQLNWQARWDTPEGELLREGRCEAIEVVPGFHACRTVECRLLNTLPKQRTLYLVLVSLKDDQVVYREDRVFFRVIPAQDGAPHSVR